MRLKVSWKDHRLVIASGDVNDKVSRLLKDIAGRFQPFSDPTSEFLISELRTNDGFLVSPHTVIGEVLLENDHLVAIDFESWKNEQYKLCTKYFFGSTVNNFDDDTSISCSIGLHSQNKLYISIAQYKKLFRLDLFDISDLKSYSKEGKHLISHWEDDSAQTYVNIYFHVKGGVVEKVESEIKTLSAIRPELKCYTLVLGKNKIEAGEAVVTQEPYDNTVLPLATVPEEVRTGNSFPDYDMDYYTTNGGNGGADEKAFADVTSTSNIRFEQVDITRAELSSTNYNGITFNSFYTDFQIVNTAEQKITLTKLSAEYFNKEGKWIAIPAYFGVKSGGGYSWRYETTLIQLGSRETTRLSTNCRIEIPKELGQNAEKLFRSHATLADPLQLRVIITDDTKVETVIPLKYQNKTEHPVFVTEKYKTQRLSSSDGTMSFFQTIDDFANNTRGYVQLLSNTDNYGDKVIYFSSNLSGTYYTIKQNTLHSLAYDAYKAKESKHFVKDWSASNSYFSLNFYSIVDLEKRRTTAFCFELTNSDKSSKSVKYFAVPDLSKAKSE